LSLLLQQFTKNSKKSIGIFVILTASALYALTHVISKPLVESNSNIEINPLILIFFIYIINGVFFTPLAQRTGGSITKIDRRSLIIIIGIGVAELIGMALYFVGLKDSTAINASLFDNAEIVFALMIAIIIFRERLTKTELVPFVMIIFGVMVIPIVYDMSHAGMVMTELLYGDILIIFSGLFLAIDVNLYKFISNKISSHRIMQLYSFSGGLLALGVIFVFDIPIEISWDQIIPITLVSLLGVGLPTMFFLVAIRLIGPVKTILVYSTTSIFGLGFAALILGESFSYIHCISTAIVIVGIYMLRKRLAAN
jgi:drug/metabolite transporter (DMT)-like permease